jgi:hypothetical protein
MYIAVDGFYRFEELIKDGSAEQQKNDGGNQRHTTCNLSRKIG